MNLFHNLIFLYRNVDCLTLDRIEGFILNIPTDYKWGILHLPMQRKHWVAVRKITENYYNLDSKLDGPDFIGPEQELILYLNEQLECKEKELLLVVSQEVATDGSWMKYEKAGQQEIKEEEDKTIMRDMNDKHMLNDKQLLRTEENGGITKVSAAVTVKEATERLPCQEVMNGQVVVESSETKDKQQSNGAQSTGRL